MYRTDSVDFRLEQLQAWLAGGWQIEEPVLQRSAYHGRVGRACAFEVVVNCAGERRVIALPDAPAVQAFLLQQELTILDLL